MTHPLWFFWGHSHLTYLRYMTLYSACKIHDDVRLVVREELATDVKWAEKQDFMYAPAGKNWMEEVGSLPVQIIPLGCVAPELVELRASEVQTSDLLAWWLLGTQGGTVCDMDIVFLKPLPAISYDVEVVVHNSRAHRYDYMPIAYMQGRPSEWWLQTYRRALENYSPDVYQSCGGENARPWPEARLSPYIVYPWVGAVFLQILSYCFTAPQWPPIREECIGIHWYAGGTQEWNQKVLGPEDMPLGGVGWAIREVLSR